MIALGSSKSSTDWKIVKSSRTMAASCARPCVTEVNQLEAVNQAVNTLPTLGNGFGLPMFAKGSIPRLTALKNEPGKDPGTRTESLVLTRLPPRAVVGQRINTMV